MAESLASFGRRGADVVNLADYRAARRGTSTSAFTPAWLPSVRRVPGPREIAHRQAMLRHLASAMSRQIGSGV